MKIDWKSREVRIALTVFLTAAALIVFYRMVDDIDNLLGAVLSLLGQIGDILLPFLMGALIAYILLPLVRWTDKKLLSRLFPRGGAHWPLSVLVVCLLVAAALVGLFAYLVPVLVSNVQEFLSNFPTYLDGAQNLVNHLLSDNALLSQPAVKGGLESALSGLDDSLCSWISGFAQQALLTIKAVANALTSTAVAIITGIYLLLDNERLKTSARRLTQALFKPARAEKLLRFVHDSDRIFGNYVRVRLFESLVVFVAMLIGYTVVPVPYPVLFSIVGAVTNLVPFYGPIVGFLFVVPLVLLIRPERALYAALFILVLQQLDGYVLEPKIMGDRVNLRPFWVLLSVTAGGALFGMAGMVLGVPVAALMAAQLSRFTERRVGSRSSPGSEGKKGSSGKSPE